MAIFNFEQAQENEIHRPERGNVEAEKVFDKYVRLTLGKVEQSLSDAKDRYEEGEADASAKPSQNWKVVKKGDTLLDEEVKVWLKIGVKKQGLFVNHKGVEVLEVKIPASKLVDQLLEFKQAIEFVRDNPDTGIAKEFHQEAIQQAKPKTEDKTDWEYDPENDLYVAI
ncbi:uncharacterized protein METZ01_LOCUS322968 [marine metagenome]|uniref:DUF4376 domain-containing protein n=1 Tax=marine metagenome TaxID=408172 RepID=A0A382P9M3_9ZZZZ